MLQLHRCFFVDVISDVICYFTFSECLLQYTVQLTSMLKDTVILLIIVLFFKACLRLCFMERCLSFQLVWTNVTYEPSLSKLFSKVASNTISLKRRTPVSNAIVPCSVLSPRDCCYSRRSVSCLYSIIRVTATTPQPLPTLCFCWAVMIPRCLTFISPMVRRECFREALPRPQHLPDSHVHSGALDVPGAHCPVLL